MSFHDVIFPEFISYGFTGGPRFRTSVTIDFGGNEQRNQEWNQARHVYDAVEGIKGETEFEALKDFFMSRRGRAFGFRFLDHLDFQAATDPLVRLDGNGLPVEDSNGDLVSTGNGAATIFQLYKLYDSGGAGLRHYREITRPRETSRVSTDFPGTTWQVRVNSVAQTEGAMNDYTVDYSTGRVTFASPPGNGLVVDWSGNFDVPVRFAEDSLETTFVDFGTRSTPFELIEIRNETDVS